MSEHDPRILATLGEGVRVSGRYVIRRVLGKGGMGHVFEVENDAIGRRFALKIISLSFASDEAVKRFRREAKALGRVSSARVAQVIDFDVDPALGPFLVMELLDGETLQQRLARTGRMGVDEAIELGTELCEALAEVHAAGIVHRDLKPSNVGLAKGGPYPVKLLDFGLAASVDDAFTERLTQSQQFLGTLPYMAPELFHGHPPTQALDLYALGVVLYEMITGRTPFIAANPAQYVAQHLASEVPPMESVVPGLRVPAWLEALVLRLLAKEAKERYASATAVASALRLRDSIGLESTMAAPSGAISGVVAATTRSLGSERGRPRIPWWALAALLAALGAGGALVALRGGRRSAPAPATATLPERAAQPATPAESRPTPTLETTRVATPTIDAPKLDTAVVAAKQLPATSKRTRKTAGKKKTPRRSWNGEILEE